MPRAEHAAGDARRHDAARVRAAGRRARDAAHAARRVQRAHTQQEADLEHQELRDGRSDQGL